MKIFAPIAAGWVLIVTVLSLVWPKDEEAAPDPIVIIVKSNRVVIENLTLTNGFVYIDAGTNVKMMRLNGLTLIGPHTDIRIK